MLGQYYRRATLGITFVKSNLIFLYTLNQSVHWFIVGLYSPVMVLFLLDNGLDSLQVGTVVGAYSGALILLELPTGGLSDSIGRKRVYLISLVVQLTAITCLIISHNFGGLLLGFFLIGTARALSSGTIDAWFVDEFKRTEPNGNLQKALAKANVFIPVGIAAGALLGGVIPMTFGHFLNDRFGSGIYESNLVIMVLAIIVQFALTSVLIIEVVNKTQRENVVAGIKKFPEVLSTAVKYGLKNRIILVLMAATFALGIGLMSVEVFWQPRLKELLRSDAQTWIFGILAAGYFLSASVGNILITPLCTKLGHNYPQILFGLRLLLGSTLLLLALQSTVLGFAALYMFFLLVNGMSGSPHSTIFNSQVPSERRSTLMSFESFIVQAGGLIGAVTFGYITQVSSIRTAWIVAGLVLLGSSLTYLALTARKYRSKIKAETCSPDMLNVTLEEAV